MRSLGTAGAPSAVMEMDAQAGTSALLALPAGWRDIAGSLRLHQLWLMLGTSDVQQRYRRSILGPLWATLSTAIFVVALGLVYSQLFGTPLATYLPFVASGVICWNFLSSAIQEGAVGYLSSLHLILNLPGPLAIHLFRVLWRGLILLGHNLVIWPVIVVALGVPVTPASLLLIPGVLVVTLNLLWMGLLLAPLCARYRDIPVLLASALQVLFFLTPVMWPASAVTGSRAQFVAYNPFYWLLEVMRAPLLGQAPAPAAWVWTVGMAILGVAVAVALHGVFRHKIAYWM